MSTATARKKKKDTDVTFHEFCDLVKEGQKADLIEGVIYIASPDNTDANRLEDWLLWILGGFVEEHELGNLYHSRVAFRLNDKNTPEPDVAFVAKDRLHLVQRGHIQGPPDLAVEIVSPDSVDRDYQKKRTQYERYGVREYWIIDEIVETQKWLHLGPKGKYREIKPKSGVLQSKVLDGFWLRPEWLWQEPRPKKMWALQQILDK